MKFREIITQKTESRSGFLVWFVFGEDTEQLHRCQNKMTPAKRGNDHRV